VIKANLEYEELYAKNEQALFKYTKGVNLNSPKQVADLLYGGLGFNELKDRRGNPLRSTAGNRRTDLQTISQLKATNKSQREFLKIFAERSKLNAALTKNLRFFRAVVSETDDGIFYANLNQTVTKTHRLSSTGKSVVFKAFNGKSKGIQFQNIPRGFKPLFSARNEGWLIGEIDAAQLEFRVAAFLGQDTQAMEDIKGGVDVHQFTAETLTRAGESTNRQDAKSRTFKPLYGGLSGTSAERTYFESFRHKYSGITAEQERWKTRVEKTKKLRIPSGLIFYWPDTKWEGSDKKPYLRNTTSICNFPVQSLATADIIPIAVVSLYNMLKEQEMRSFIVNTIHDSVIMEVHPDEVEGVERLAEVAFDYSVTSYLKEVYNIDWNVPLEIEAKFGSYWNE
jgi:DNA polymerase I-like protein with 3'-5' exonuclease and polymerase domains